MSGVGTSYKKIRLRNYHERLHRGISGAAMKFNMSKEWFMKMAKLEEGCNIGAGSPPVLDCAQSPDGQHHYDEVDLGNGWSRCTCRHCGHSYKLDEEEMK